MKGTRVLNVLMDLKSKGRKESTIRTVGKRLRSLAKSVNLDKPESVNRHIAEKECSNNFKGNLVDSYKHYAEYYGLSWSKPFYQREERVNRVPSRENINKIISHSKLRARIQRMSNQNFSQIASSENARALYSPCGSCQTLFPLSYMHVY